MKLKSVLESVVRKRVIRAGKMKIILTSSIPGFKIVSGREKMMSSAEKLARKMSQRKGARKRKSKKAQTLLRRQRSLARRVWK